MNRRAWLETALLGAAGLLGWPLTASGRVTGPDHRVTLDVPALAEDPAAVPVRVAADHPMEPDHWIRSIEVVLDTDPIPHKGTYRFTPGSGRAVVGFPMRSGAGGLLRATAECSRHGRFATTRELSVAGGGCAGPADPPDKSRLGRPKLRVLGPVRRGETAEVLARLDHDSDTGLAFRDGRYVRVRPEFYLRQVRVYVDRRLVNDFRLTSALSPNPILRFPVRVMAPGTLRVVFVNSEGRQWEAAERLEPAG